MKVARGNALTWIVILAAPLGLMQSLPLGLFSRVQAQERQHIASTPGTFMPAQPRIESIGSIDAAAPRETATPQPLSAAQRAMMNRAWDLLQNNDVAAARLIFKKLAEANVAEAAFELAQTYDPDFLRTIPTAGLQPDPAMAQQWYERAAALGNMAAASRLSKLNAR